MRLRPALPWLAVALIGAWAGAAETEVLCDGSGVADWTTSRDADRLSREFWLSEITRTTAPATLRWRFVPRETAFNDLFLRRPIAKETLQFPPGRPRAGQSYPLLCAFTLDRPCTAAGTYLSFVRGKCELLRRLFLDQCG